jgi:hypothetical protein
MCLADAALVRASLVSAVQASLHGNVSGRLIKTKFVDVTGL